MINLQNHLNSIKLNWICKYIDNSHGKWKWFFEYWFEKLGGEQVILNCRCDPTFIRTKCKFLPTFYSEMLFTYFSFREIIFLTNKRVLSKSSDICKEILWLNANIKYGGEMLLFKNWIKSNIIFVGDIVERDGIIPMSKLKEKMVVCDGRFFSEYARCRVALKRVWSESLVKNNVELFTEYRNRICIENKCKIFENIKLLPLTKTKDIYRVICSWDQVESRAILFWTETLRPNNEINWSNIWTFKLKTVQDNALIHFNFKFMYNILPTPKNLFKWQQKENKCQFCNEIGSLLHMFYYCPILSFFWKYIENIVKRYSFDATFVIEPQMLIYGFDFSKANLIDLSINYAILAIHRTILLLNQGKKYTGNEFIIMFKSILKKTISD